MVSASFIQNNCGLSNRLLMLLLFFFVCAPPLLPRRRAGVYTAQFVQERGAAAQRLCCHGEHGFGCLHRRGNRDLFNRYTAALNLMVLMTMTMM